MMMMMMRTEFFFSFWFSELIPVKNSTRNTNTGNKKKGNLNSNTPTDEKKNKQTTGLKNQYASDFGR